MEIHTSPGFDAIFASYPDLVKPKMDALRQLVRDTAYELAEVSYLTETLKWGEPSFVTKHGSTLRMDWKEKTPHQYAMYFQCSSRLVPTFKTVFPDTFQFEGKRAIVFTVEGAVPIVELKACIKAALLYHKVKHELTLGI